MSITALSAHHLSWGPEPGLTLVDDVSLAVAAGERLAIIGPNGAGKTTLLRLLCGRLKPRKGRIDLGGQDLATIQASERARHIAVLVQSDMPHALLNVADYVWLGRLPHLRRVARQKHEAAARLAMETTGVAHLARRSLGSLSGGERQRVNLARALAQEPALLFLDEPTNHLDPSARIELLDLVKRLGLTVIAILHDLPLVSAFADRVAVMAGGRVVACDRPEHAMTRDIMREVFALDVATLIHPRDGRPLFVFDRLQPQEPLRRFG